MSNNGRWQERIHIWITLIIVVLTSCVSYGQNAQDSHDTQALILQLKERTAAFKKANTPESWTALLDGIRALSSCGERGVETIADAIHSEKNATLICFLARALAEIPGAKAGKSLVSLYCANPSIRDSIAGGIEAGRVNKHIAMGYVLSDDELRVFQSEIEKGHSGKIWQIAGIMSICRDTDVSIVVDAMVKRFLEQITEPVPESRKLYYLPPQIALLDHFNSGFGVLGQAAIPALKRAHRKSASRETHKWLTIALGSAGDPEMAAALADILQHDPDRYLRCVVIPAYAHSAKQDAIPLLESFEDDTTVSEFSQQQPCYLLRSAANSAPSKLAEESPKPDASEFAWGYGQYTRK